MGSIQPLYIMRTKVNKYRQFYTLQETVIISHDSFSTCFGSSKNTTWKSSFHPHLCWSFPQPLGQSALCCVVTEALVVARGWTEKVTKGDNYSLKVIKSAGKPQLGKQVKHSQPCLHTVLVRLCWLPSSYLAHAQTPCTILKCKVFLSWSLQLTFTWGSISSEIVSPFMHGAEPNLFQHHLVLHKSSP